MSKLNSKFLGGDASDIYATPSAYPRNKFQFDVELFVNTLATSNLKSKTYKLQRIAEVSMPSHQFSTMEVNQYNIKRTINIGTSLSPITVTAYDTRDSIKLDSIESILKAYAQYYYAGIMTSDGLPEKDYGSLISEGFRNGTSGRGYSLPDQKYLFSELKITRRSGDADVNVITLYNPMITSVAGDQLSYSDSGPVTYRIDFSYESYDTRTIDTSERDKDG